MRLDLRASMCFIVWGGNCMFFIMCCCFIALTARSATAKINFPAGTIKFILFYLILARQTKCEHYETSPIPSKLDSGLTIICCKNTAIQLWCWKLYLLCGIVNAAISMRPFQMCHYLHTTIHFKTQCCILLKKNCTGPRSFDRPHTQQPPKWKHFAYYQNRTKPGSQLMEQSNCSFSWQDCPFNNFTVPSERHVWIDILCEWERQVIERFHTKTKQNFLNLRNSSYMKFTTKIEKDDKGFVSCN